MTTSPAAAVQAGAWPTDFIQPRLRVIADNDYSGDPDGLVELAHQLLSPSVDVRLVIGGQVASQGHEPASSVQASVEAAAEIAGLAARPDVQILAGADRGMASTESPSHSPAAEAIVEEAMRSDSDLPLVVTCGGSLTNIASAWLMEPRIAERLRLVWIGGQEHPDLAEPLPGVALEHNTSIDPVAAQVVFNESNLRLWQVPRDAYAQVVASRSELLIRMRRHGALGAHLFDMLGLMVQRSRHEWGGEHGETYVLGDSPLVLLTALQSNWFHSPTSCRWVRRPASPALGRRGLRH